ncbi:MAG: NlpC/P60 family protein [Pseudomonadota bacterium]
MNPKDFALAAIGKPWQSGATGPDAYDCFGLLRAYYLAVRGVQVPVVDVDAHHQLAVRHAIAHGLAGGKWAELAAPAEGCAVLMSQANYPDHVGVWLDIDSGGVLHAIRGAGVIYTNRRNLAASGWNIVGLYQFCGAP